MYRVPISNGFVSTTFRSGSNFSEPQLVRVPFFGYRVPTVFQSCSKNRITVYNHVLPSIRELKLLRLDSGFLRENGMSPHVPY